MELDPERKEPEETLMKERQARARAAAKAEAKQDAKSLRREKERQKDVAGVVRSGAIYIFGGKPARNFAAKLHWDAIG